MSKTGKIVLWVTVAIVLIGGGLGTYFVLKPKEGQTKVDKDGKSYTFTDGKWVLDSEISDNTNTGGSSNNGGGGSGTKSCYDETVETLQKKLIAEGAQIDKDGCMGTKTKTAMNNYGYSLSGNKILKTTIVAPALKLGLWTATDSVNTFGVKKINNAFDVDLTNKGKISKKNSFIGTILEFKAISYGSYGSMNVIRVLDNKGNNVWVQNQNNVVSKKTVEV